MLHLMEVLAHELRLTGWTLRSGHAPGADQAFERGAEEEAEVFLPWATFEDSVPIEAKWVTRKPALDAFTVAEQHHPAWYALKPGAKLLQARNSHQVLGQDLKTPVKFVVCWTPDGSIDGKGPDTGGTGQALRIADAHEIPVFNLKHPEHIEVVSRFIQNQEPV